MSKLIVIDGLDGSGKATQTDLVAKYLNQKGEPTKIITFPHYSSRSSELVKMYLAGEISKDPNDVNAYAAASFYAADRYISFTKSWHLDYEAGTTILCDRYVSSNLIHQMVKLDQKEWDTFIHWLHDYEFEKLGLPVPQLVIYLDMDPTVSQKLIENRYQGDTTKKDIHETNLEYLKACREAALYAARRLGWHVIHCSDGETPYTIEQISETIKQTIER